MRGVDCAISPRDCLLSGVGIGWKLIDMRSADLSGGEIHRTVEAVHIRTAKAATNR